MQSGQYPVSMAWLVSHTEGSRVFQTNPFLRLPRILYGNAGASAAYARANREATQGHPHTQSARDVESTVHVPIHALIQIDLAWPQEHLYHSVLLCDRLCTILHQPLVTFPSQRSIVVRQLMVCFEHQSQSLRPLAVPHCQGPRVVGSCLLLASLPCPATGSSACASMLFVTGCVLCAAMPVHCCGVKRVEVSHPRLRGGARVVVCVRRPCTGCAALSDAAAVALQHRFHREPVHVDAPTQ